MSCSHKLGWFFALLLATGLTGQAADEPKQVTKLDGTKIFGLVEVTDDYTLRIRSDSGIQNIPIALLGEKDFRKYGFSKDRTKDGRLWSERKEALESEKDEKDEKDDSKKNESGDIEIRLSELAPFQPLIAAYESLKPPKAAEKEKDPKGEEEAKPPEKSSSLQMFTGPGSLNIPDVPFGSGAAGTVIQPASSAASSAAGLVPGLTPP